MDQDEAWHAGRPRPRPHCVRWGPSSLPKKGHSPQFSAHVYCGQTAVCIRIPLGTEVYLSLGNIVLDGDPAPPPLNGHSPPIFSRCPLWPNSWMTKMPLGMEVSLVLDDLCSMGTQLSPEKSTQPPSTQFLARVYCGQMCMDQHATWYRGKPRPRRRYVRWCRSSVPPKRGTARQFLVHVYCGQMARWMNRPLGTDVDLGPGYIVLDGDPAPP